MQVVKFKFLPFLLAGVFFLIGLITLDDYGINWDEPGHFMRGQAYWCYFLTGKKDYQGMPRLKIHYPKDDRHPFPSDIEFEDDSQFRRSLYQSDHWNGKWFLSKDSGHPPLSDILAAATNWLFYQKLGIFGDIEAYHLFELFASTVLVLVVALFAMEVYGPLAGLVTGLSLVLYPLFLGESHFNIKDPVETCFFGLTIYTFWKAIKHQSARWMIASSIFCGLALGTKFNIAFILLVILPWLAVVDVKEELSKNLLLSLFLYPFVVFAIFFLSWPYLWQDPKNHFLEVLKYYKGIGMHQIFQPLNFYIHGFNTYPLQAIIFTTPLVILFFALIGIIASLFLFKKEEDKTSFLWLLWLIVPVARVTIPGTVIYGGVRQIMEYIPAMALMAGLGAKHVVTHFPPATLCVAMRAGSARQIKKKRELKFAITLLVLLMFLPITLKMIQIHPNEGLYFNPLIGGLKGAVERNFPNWGLSLGNEYRQGIEWFNQNAPWEANLTLARGLLSNIPRIWIRSDINFGDYYFSGKERKGEYIMGLIYEGWENWIPEKAAYLKNLEPVYQVKVEGVPVLAIWKNGN